MQSLPAPMTCRGPYARSERAAFAGDGHRGQAFILPLFPQKPITPRFFVECRDAGTRFWKVTMGVGHVLEE